MTQTPRVHRFEAMGCPCALHVHGETDAVEHYLRRARAEIARMDAKYSSYLAGSLISDLNRRAGEVCTVDRETAAILAYADACFEASDGLFDITAGIYRRLWREGMRSVPDAADLAHCQARAGWQRVAWDGERLCMKRGMVLDLGGVVKEYAADALGALARECDISAGLIDLGGDLLAIGPHPDGQPWTVGVADPMQPSTARATTTLRAGAIATSGNYERGYMVDGVRYSHLIDPRSGWPVEGLESVSVIADRAIVAGSLASIACLKPEEQALPWLREQGAPFFAVDREGRHHSHAPTPAHTISTARCGTKRRMSEQPGPART